PHVVIKQRLSIGWKSAEVLLRHQANLRLFLRLDTQQWRNRRDKLARFFTLFILNPRLSQIRIGFTLVYQSDRHAFCGGVENDACSVGRYGGPGKAARAKETDKSF